MLTSHPSPILKLHHRLRGYLEKGTLVMDLRKIACRYLSTWFVPAAWNQNLAAGP